MISRNAPLCQKELKAMETKWSKIPLDKNLNKLTDLNPMFSFCTTEIISKGFLIFSGLLEKVFWCFQDYRKSPLPKFG